MLFIVYYDRLPQNIPQTVLNVTCGSFGGIIGFQFPFLLVLGFWLAAPKDQSSLVIVSVIVRVHQSAETGQKAAKSTVCVISRKINHENLHAGRHSGSAMLMSHLQSGPMVLSGTSAWSEGQTAGAVIVENTYDSNEFCRPIADMKAEVVIPQKETSG
nr:hypothetical protein [Acetobacter persici]